MTSRILFAGRIQAGAHEEVAGHFSDSDRTELPRILGVKRRILFSYHDLYFHFVEFAGDAKQAFAKAQQHEEFARVSSMVAPYISPYDAQTYHGHRDAMAREFYSYEPTTEPTPNRTLIVARLRRGAEEDVASLFTASDRDELPHALGVKRRMLFSYHDLYFHFVEFAGDVQAALAQAREREDFAELHTQLDDYLSPYDPATRRSPTDALAREFYTYEPSARAAQPVEGNAR